MTIGGIIGIAAWTVALLASVPVVTLAVICLAGAGRRRISHYAGEPPPITVVMPAHDEAAGIAAPIRAVLAQLRSCDELIVIADNCSDDTAAIAQSLGARVVTRDDPAQRGKGYALEAGQPAVTQSPGRIVIVVDADCIAAPHALHHLASTASRHQAVVQSAYLLTTPADAPALVRISAFAFLIKNLVRQAGLQRLASAALLQGSGMAFPVAAFMQLRWRGESLVEDLDMGIDLLVAGRSVMFDSGALFLSAAASLDATAGQRRRWEHGMLQSMARNVPQLLRASLRRPQLFILALDQMIPPAAMLIAVAAALLLLLIVAGVWGAAALLLAALSLLALTLVLIWVRYRDRLGGGIKVAEVARYLIWKLPIAWQFVTRRERQWLRTGREP